MACGPPEVTTEYVPLQYVSSLVWGYNRIYPAAISLVVRLRLQPNMSRLQYVSWLVWCCNRIHPAAICISLFALLTFVPHLHLSYNIMGRFEKCSKMICMKSQVGFDHFLALLNFVPRPFFRHCSFLYLTHTQIQAQRKIPWDDLKNATKWYAWSVELDFFTLLTFVPRSHSEIIQMSQK